jgi:enterochelin esterase-like enzyme
MKPSLLIPVSLLTIAAFGANHASAATINDVYLLGPDSEAHPGVPQGKVTDWEKLPSQAYPGTLHDFCVYVPAQYDPATLASLMIFQDGQAWLRQTGDIRAQFVFDNLIYRREIPVTIVVFINPGRTPEQPVATGSEWGDHSSNRPQEYNAVDDKYARVIVDELMPVLNLRYNISKNPDDRAIGGASSGAIAAFGVAWNRPDQFHKVLSTVGSFTNIRGGDAYPDIIRAAERKPIRVYLLDGVNDNRGKRSKEPGSPYDPRWDWHLQNIRMLAALKDKGYDVNNCWGIGPHSQNMAGAMLPEMLRWLWRDYPRVDDPHDNSNRTLFTVGEPAAPTSASAAKP